jgi:HlyD family secretion protein
VDSAVNRRDLAAAELASAQEQWDTLEGELSAEREAAEARVAQTKAALDKATLDAVQDRIRRADVTSAQAQVARAEAQLANAETTLGYTTIVAPRAGVILEKFVEEGTIVTSARSSVTQGTDIVLLGDLTEMFVEVSLDEADVGMVEVGQPTAITIDAFPDDQFQGTVSRIDPQALTQQNVTTVLVTVRIDDVNPRLKPGMTATCEFMIGRAENVLCLPSLAVQERQGRHTVLMMQDGEPTPVPVEIGLVGDNLTEIRGGVAEGDGVVLSFAGPAPGGMEDRAREMGRRMGGAGGFVR